MTGPRTETQSPIREITAEEAVAVIGGARGWVNPFDIYAFNPQPDPPAKPIMPVQVL